MTDLAELFSSKAKFKVLKFLVKFSEPIALRTIANLTDTPVRSVVLALESLLKEKIIHDIFSGRNRLFQLSKSHPLFKELINIFSEIERAEIRMRSQKINSEAMKALKFASSARQLFQQ